MAKTKEELNRIKEEYEAFTSKLQELTDEELKVVTGGFDYPPMENDNEFASWKNDEPEPTLPGNYKLDISIDLNGHNTLK